MNSERNLSRRRAAFAFSAVDGWPEGKTAKEHTQLARKLPMALRA